MEKAEFIGTEKILLEDTYGRILAEPIIAKNDLPPFDRSIYDGFAVRAEDTTQASEYNPVRFTVIGEIGAGSVKNQVIAAGEAYRIMTGAQIPPNADAVVMLEETVEQGNTFMLHKPLCTDENVLKQGVDAYEGTKLIEAGGFIHPGTVALLAAFGYAEVEVARCPVVSILSTGTELLDVSQPLVPGKIHDSNGPMIATQLRQMGIAYKSFGMLEDDLAVCMETVRSTLKKTDVLITTGGVSVGDFDFLPAIYEQLGAEVLFNKVAMRPGSVTTVAVLNNKLLFGLSGNPSACFTGFELFVRPAILRMMKANQLYLQDIKAIIKEDFRKPNPFIRFIRATWEMTERGPVVASAGFNKTSAITSIAHSNCLLVLPAGTDCYLKGMEMDILLLGEEQGVRNWLGK